MKSTEITTVIFDLGGVVLDLDMTKTFDLLGSQSARGSAAFADLLHKPGLFHDFEVGRITQTDFRKQLSDWAGLSTTDLEFDTMWNAMLLNIPEERLQWIAALRNKYTTALLSNTNEIHVQAFEKNFQEQVGKPLQHYFHHVFYSCRMDSRKPDAAIFEHVLQALQVKAENVLFLDDNPDNVAGAQSVGMRAVLVPQNQLSQEMLPDVE